MNRFRNIMGLVLMGMAMTACQSKHFKIQGTAEGMEDGDTLFLTADLMTGRPSDTIVVEKGKFELTGETDSTYLALLMTRNAFDEAVYLFVEPGTISVVIGTEPEDTRVGGTKANDALQTLTDTLTAYQDQMIELSKAFADSVTTPEKQAALMAAAQRLDSAMTSHYVKAAEANVDNEFGYFLITNYEFPDGDEQRLRLIEQMPAKMRERDLVRLIKEEMGH